DPRGAPPRGASGAAPGALRAPGRGVQRKSKKSARSADSFCLWRFPFFRKRSNIFRCDYFVTARSCHSGPAAPPVRLHQALAPRAALQPATPSMHQNFLQEELLGVLRWARDLHLTGGAVNRLRHISEVNASLLEQVREVLDRPRRRQELDRLLRRASRQNLCLTEPAAQELAKLAADAKRWLARGMKAKRNWEKEFWALRVPPPGVGLAPSQLLAVCSYTWLPVTLAARCFDSLHVTLAVLVSSLPPAFSTRRPAAEVLREALAHRFRLIRLCAPRSDWTRRWRARLRPLTKKYPPPAPLAVLLLSVFSFLVCNLGFCW
ncbi:unnamed protein product, partial [Prorocentrum cordatum]